MYTKPQNPISEFLETFKDFARASSALGKLEEDIDRGESSLGCLPFGERKIVSETSSESTWYCQQTYL